MNAEGSLAADAGGRELRVEAWWHALSPFGKRDMKTPAAGASSHLQHWARIAIVALGVTGGSLLTAREQLVANFEPGSRRLELSATGLDGDYELRIDTPGVRELELGADVNEPGIIYLPPETGPISLTQKPEIPRTAENVFFFHDISVADGWQLVVRFPGGSGGSWKLNGRFSKLGGALAEHVIIPVAHLEPGENLLHIRSEQPHRPELYFRRTIPPGGRFSEAVIAARANWTGRVSLVRTSADGVAEVRAIAEVEGRPLARRDVAIGDRPWEQPALLTEAAVAVGRNLLAAQVRDSRSVFHGGFNLVYDAQRQAHRMAHWLWAWGPAIALLLDLEKLPAAKQAGLDAPFRAAALAAGKRSLAFEMTDPKHPAHGISTVRWEPSRAAPNGWVEYLSTADSLFLAGWGWMSCHAATGDSIYLERTRSLVAAAERLMRQYPVVPQDWVVERNRWTPHTLDESVFGMIAFRELYSATKSRAVADAGRRFLDSHLEHMGRESGLLERAWLRDENRAIWDPDIKGHAWVIEGYLDAHLMSGDARYLQLARLLADRVMACQHADGAWTHAFRYPKPADPRDDKGTAIWAYLFYGVYRQTGDTRHLDAARRALAWCLRQQYRGEDPYLDGGILHANSMAYVRLRPMTILYSTTFFGLALLEELKLARREAERP